LNTTVQIWQAKLYQREKIPFAIDRIEAQKALNDLLILHQAAQRHNGGDAQGLVYPNLWTHFLEPLSKWLNRSKYKRGSSSYESTI